MLCVSVKSFVRSCGSVSGGVSDILIGDPSDFNFTSAGTGPYTAVTRRAGATAEGGALLYAMNFTEDEANRTWKQSRKGCSTKYDHEVRAQLPQLSQDLTEWLQSIDAAGCCCGLLLIVRDSSGKIFVLGEKYVNGTSIPKFKVVMDGSDGDSGKLLDDFNGANVVFKSSYSREAKEFTGTWDALQALTDGAQTLSIATQPVGNAYAVGGTITLSTAPSGGTLPYTHQWQKSTDGGATWSDINGATAATFTKSNAQVGDAGSYRDHVGHAGAGTINTNAAVVTVA